MTREILLSLTMADLVPELAAGGRRLIISSVGHPCYSRTLMLSSDESADAPRTPAPRKIDYRLLAAAILLMAAVVSTWLTIETLSARRKLRMDLAEISHVRYGLLSADNWVRMIVPILEARIDALELKKADRASLRPCRGARVVPPARRGQAASERKETARQRRGVDFPGMGNAMMANLMVGALRPHVPEYASVVMAELGKPETLNTVKSYMKNTLGRWCEEHLRSCRYALVRLHPKAARLRGRGRVPEFAGHANRRVGIEGELRIPGGPRVERTGVRAVDDGQAHTAAFRHRGVTAVLHRSAGWRRADADGGSGRRESRAWA